MESATQSSGVLKEMLAVNILTDFLVLRSSGVLLSSLGVAVLRPWRHLCISYIRKDVKCQGFKGPNTLDKAERVSYWQTDLEVPPSHVAHLPVCLYSLSVFVLKTGAGSLDRGQPYSPARTNHLLSLLELRGRSDFGYPLAAWGRYEGKVQA